VLCVASGRSPTADAADEFLTIADGSEVACLSTLRALVQGLPLDETEVRSQTGAPLQQWQALAEQLAAARYAVLFYEPASGDAAGPDALARAITMLVRDLHRHTRAAALRLGPPANSAGAAQVLTWQTGFPGAVSLAGGYPRYLPDEATAQRLLERGEADAALVIGADPVAHLTAAAGAQLASLPCVAIDDRQTATTQAATVALFTSTFGIETTGSVYRSDGVALPLRAARPPQRVDAAAVLGRLAERLQASMAGTLAT
jgi:formylmethanofuran dehydrogenase subunit B